MINTEMVSENKEQSHSRDEKLKKEKLATTDFYFINMDFVRLKQKNAGYRLLKTL